MTQQQRDTYDRVVLMLTGLVGGFIFFSLVAQFVLVYTGRLDGDDAGVWKPIFDMVLVLVSAIGGYVTGERVERARRPPSEGGDH